MSSVYKVGYHTPEESLFREFTSDVTIDRSEFLMVVKRCLLAVLRTLATRPVTEIADLFSGTAFVSAMISEGFRPMRYEHVVDLEGWARLGDGFTDTETREVLDFLAQAEDA